MRNYIVKRDFPLTDGIHRKGGEVRLSERQARHLLIAGFIDANTEPKPVKRTVHKRRKRKV